MKVSRFKEEIFRFHCKKWFVVGRQGSLQFNEIRLEFFRFLEEILLGEVIVVGVGRVLCRFLEEILLEELLEFLRSLEQILLGEVV